MPVEPLYTGELRGKRLRFFRPPGGQEDFPWVSWDDLLLAVDLPRQQRRVYSQMMAKDWKADTKVIDTEPGLTTIVCHSIVQGLLGAQVELGRATAALENEYYRLGVQAMRALTAHIADPAERFQFTIRCAQRAVGKGETP